VALRGPCFQRMEVDSLPGPPMDPWQTYVVLTPRRDRTSSDRPLHCSGFREKFSLVGGYRLSLSILTQSSSSSSIVKHVTALRSAGLAYIGYFFFDFRDESKQSCNSLLHSLLYQLSTQSGHFSDQLSHLHSLYEDGKQPPSDRTLTRCLKSMLSLSAHCVYLIIDGVDECPDTQVLNLIEELVGHRLSNLRICATSRPDVGALKHLTTLSVSLHKQRGHKQEITNHIYSAVYSDPKMGIWSEKDKRLVVETVSKKADGV
jgi:hypothetical protein